MNKAADEARAGHLAYFESLSEEELKGLISKKDEDGRSLLHTAAASGKIELSQFLASKGCDKYIDDADEEGWTPLMSAVSAGHEAAAQLLVSLEAMVNLVNSGGRSAIHYAGSKGSPGMIRLLLKHGAEVGKQDKTGSTALHRAASAGKSEAARILVEEGKARLETTDRLGQTALFVAVSCDQAATKGEETPLSVAGSMRSALLGAAPKDEDM
eukprot:gene5531-4165_t